MARRDLREGTARDHDRVDRLFSRFDLTDRGSYARFLAAQAAAFLPIEAGIDAADATRVVPDWPKRRRSALLRADLHDLGMVCRDLAVMPPFDHAADVLGTVYVLEGSRLGGAMLARSVPPAFPRRFLGASDSRLWRTLIEMLDAALVTADDRDRALAAARSTFRMFEQGAARQLELADLD